MSNVIGVDVGGTKIAAALLNTQTEAITGDVNVPTEAHQGTDAVLKRIADVVRQVSDRAGIPLHQIDGVGVGLPATMDVEKGITYLIPNLPGDWWGKPVADILRGHLDRPFGLINDARAFTLAEATLGAGRGAPSVVGITLGTGIGGGIVINGRLHLGLMGSAGEVGHHTIDMHGLPDGSGNPGGWEGLASGPAIAAMGVKAVMQGLNTRIGELVAYDIRQITPRTIVQAAEQDDAVAIDILQRAGTYIGVGLSNIITILAPHCVVIGGGVAALGDWIMKPALQTLHERCHTVPLDKITIVQAELGNKAGLIGAAQWVGQLSED
jgi:glucokinase